MANLHDIFQILSAVGDGIILLMYLLLLSNRVCQESWGYLYSNLVGSLMVLLDVVAEFSVSQLLVQSGWLIVSAVALFAAIRSRWLAESQKSRAANDMAIPDSDAIVDFVHRRT